MKEMIKCEIVTREIDLYVCNRYKKNYLRIIVWGLVIFFSFVEF